MAAAAAVAGPDAGSNDGADPAAVGGGAAAAAAPDGMAADARVSISSVFQEGTWVVIQQDDAKKPLPRYEQGAALMGPNLYVMGGHYSEWGAGWRTGLGLGWAMRMWRDGYMTWRRAALVLGSTMRYTPSGVWLCLIVVKDGLCWNGAEACYHLWDSSFHRS